MNERDVTSRWRELFQGQTVTPALLKQADALLGRLSCESPLRVRLAKELEDIRDLPGNAPARPKTKRAK